jgi:peptidoglycan/xylan/chitin deacetylase (PgdA/CDA1 family)
MAPQTPLRRAIPFLTAGLAALLAGWPDGGASAADSAVVFMYHRFGEDGFPTTNIRLDQFEAHLEELATGGYTVLAVPEILEALEAGRPLPEQAVGLTVDDAYLSVYTEAWPRLRAAGFPFTLFVSTDPVDKGYRTYMSWDQIRELAAAGAAVGGHTASHLHMVDATPDEVTADIARSHERFRAELGAVPEIFAYPFGEMSFAVRDQVMAAGYRFAFGQHSGASHGEDDVFNLPRFALNESYGGLGQFRLRAQALPLPVADVTPADRLLGTNPPVFGFTVAPRMGALDRLNCYATQQGRARVERLGEHRIEVRLDAPFAPGRSRINCTLPGPDGRWRWFGTLFYLPKG